MQPENRNRLEFIKDLSRYSLIGLLLINILSVFVILFINPEAFFLGYKIAGAPAVLYAMGLIFITVIVMVFLYYKIKGHAIIALVYGMLFFINGYLTVLYYNNKVPPAIYWLVLLLSVTLFCTTLLIKSGKPAEPNVKSVDTIFMGKPWAGLLVSAGVLLCFLLITSIGFISYQKEYNTCLYQIEIYPDTPVHNVTLMMPLPSGNFRKNMSKDLIGNSLSYFTNYSQSLVETENGTMLKITADSIEKPGDGLPQEPLRLYQSFMVEGPRDPSSPPDNQPVLSPEWTLLPDSCSNTQFQGILSGKRPSDCSHYESGVYATFETDPASQTIITVSFDRTRIISSSQSLNRDAFQERITATIFGNAEGWFNATGSFLAG